MDVYIDGDLRPDAPREGRLGLKDGGDVGHYNALRTYLNALS